MVLQNFRPLNLNRKYAKIFSRIWWGFEIGVAFNIGNQWSVFRVNGSNEGGWLNYQWLKLTGADCMRAGAIILPEQ